MMVSKWLVKKKIIWFYALLGIACLVLLDLSIMGFLKRNPLIITDIAIDTVPYVLAEQQPSHLPSRSWIAYAIEIVKKERLSPVSASRFLTYTASLYSDVLDKTEKEDEASLATAQLITSFFPKYQDQTDEQFKSLGGIGTKLSDDSKKILEDYLNRSLNDGFSIKWDQQIPEDSRWFIKENEVDPDASAKDWKTWIIDKNEIAILSPPKKNSLTDNIELKKVEFFVNKRSFDYEETIFFWEGIDNFYDYKKLHNPISGIWLNILYVEFGSSLDNANFARYQKILSQTITDSLILTWRAKYTHFTPRPSMTIPSLETILPNPPYPSFVSEHAAVSQAAFVTLSAIFPEKKEALENLAKSASYSRIFAGTQFEIDAKAGLDIGKKVGIAVVQKYFPEIKITKSENLKRSFEPFAIFAELIDYVEIHTLLSADLTKRNNNIPTFVNAAEESGLEDIHGEGTSWGDYNSDGYLDLLVANGLFRNTGDGKFIRVDTHELLRGPGFFGDFNNDGCPDIYIVRSGPTESIESKGYPDILYRNNCDGTFTDLTYETGIKDEYHGVSAAWADYNNDGYLDIYVVNRGTMPGGLDFDKGLNTPYRFEPNILYRNNGDGTFTNATEYAGVDNLLDCDVYSKDPVAKIMKIKIPFQPVWFDYNNDNKPDLLIVTDTYMSPFYENNGDGTFTQITKRAGLCGRERDANMGAAIGDYNGDGYLDIYMSDNGNNYLWQNNGNGTFTNMVHKAGVDDLGYGWGTESLDYDNDGNLDILVVNGNNRIPAKAYYIPNLKHNDLDELFKNNGDGTFNPVGIKEGLSGNEIKMSATVVDYNNDGFPDIFIPSLPGKRHPTDISKLYKNKSNDNHWLTIQLIGVKSNRDAVGARITLEAGGKKQIREIISGSSYVSQSSPWPTFGLGKNIKVDELHIRWPSGLIQTFNNLPVNKKIIIKEGDNSIY